METAFDLVIIGTGVAGVCAAVSALETNPDLDVVLLDRAPEGEHGGNSRFTDAYMRLEADGSPPEGFVDDFEAFSNGRADMDIVRTLHDDARDTIRWLEGHGVDFEPMETMFLTSNRPRLLPVGGGLTVVDEMLETATARGATVRYETTAERLTTDEDGGVDGVLVRDGTGDSYRIAADAVVIACGGFEGDPRMLAQYLDGNVVELDPVAAGGFQNKGEGVRMALDVGGATDGQFEQFHAEPVDPRLDIREVPEPAVMCFPYGILVNKNGERFVDEAATTVDEHYEYVSRRIREQPDNVAYVIADQKLFDVPNVERSVMSPEEPYEADADYASSVDPLESTVRNLAEEIDVDASRLVETIRNYNEHVEDGEFDPHRLDGKRANTSPPKSNWAQRLDRPPFVAYPIACANVFTFGGVATDTDGRVLNGDDRPIPGLYAAGEVTGLYFHKYIGATSVLRGLVFGRRAGAHAASHVA